jgi:hypothetical protein
MNPDVRRRARGMTVSVSALSVLALSGAAAAADQCGPKVVEEHATVSNSTVTRVVRTDLPNGGEATASATASAENDTASVSVRVETEGGAVRATAKSSSVSDDPDRSRSVHPQ